MKLIDKDVLVVEIERRRDTALMRQKNLESIGQESVINEMVANELNRIISFINTLEVKEVDLDKETTHYLLYEHRSPLNEIMHRADLKSEMQYCKDIENAFKAGFELGLKAQKGE